MLNLFKVGVTVALVDRMSGALGTIGTSLNKAHGQTAAYQAQLAKVQQRVDTLSAAKFAGEAVFHASASALEAMIDPSIEYQSQINRMNLMGMKHEEIVKNIASAWKTTGDVMTTTATENLLAQSEIFAAIGTKGGSMQEGREMLTRLQEMKMVMMAAVENPEEVSTVNELTYATVKFAEQLNKYDSAGILHIADRLEESIAKSGGKLKPTDFQMMGKYMRGAKLPLSEHEMFDVAPVYMLAYQGAHGSGGVGGPGNMYASLFNQLGLGKMSKATVDSLTSLGLMHGKPEPNMTTMREARGLEKHELFVVNPTEWMQTVLRPKLIERNPELEHNTAAMALATAMALGGPRTAQDLAEQMITHMPAIKIWQEKNVGTHEDRVRIAKESPRVAAASVEAQWQNLMLSISKDVMVIFVQAVQMAASTLHGIADFVGQNKWASGLILLGTVAAVAISGFIAVGAGIGLALIPLAAAGIAFGSFALVAGMVGLVAVGLVAAFIAVPALLRDIQRGWYAFNVFMANSFITLAEQGAAWIGGFVSKFDEKKGAEITNWGHEEAFRLSHKFAGQFADFKAPPPIPGAHKPEFDWMKDGQIKEPASFHQTNVGDIHITQQPNQSPQEVVDEIMKQMNKGVLTGLQTSGPGMGMSSPYSLASSIAGGG